MEGVAQERRERRAMWKVSTFEILGSSGRIASYFGGRVTDVARFIRDGWFHSAALWWSDD
jgi:hypothetical protein